MDVVALAAVVSSGLTSLAAIGYQAYGDHRRRTHDARQAFEERAWEKKSEPHYELIGVCRRLTAVLRTDLRSMSTVRYLTREAAPALSKLAPEIMAYGSQRCRRDLETVEQKLAELDVDSGLLFEAEDAFRQKERAIDARRFEEAATQRDRECQALERLTATMGLDRDGMQAAIDALLESARESVRSSAL
ncbi:hypothetical protein ACWDT5_09845 [Rhodococcus aetherivorans]